jgi:dihydroorotate dehydrogenase
MSPEQLKEINDRLIPVIAHDRAGLGSALISVGLLVLMLALWGFQQGEKWVWYTFLIGGIPAFSAGIVTHYVIGYTTFVHLLPVYIGLLLYVGGLILSKDFFFKGEMKIIK